ncbi:hypothetical protein H696_04492 [Fonticula alba]|uniref:Uncharacterized protein n=1 Tax=Fonticula alba TaxID=691883 RepID=A0A058Z6D1_FONAL|nr:hypothetical protein H696_04492 [Fonticula alba]KCV69077.1 hypothetical protein H696_04492 [Fonticula alba]|eukprot:XP_009496648.1 hypothetical protein H696_04492 [Fonticula alba]
MVIEDASIERFCRGCRDYVPAVRRQVDQNNPPIRRPHEAMAQDPGLSDGLCDECIVRLMSPEKYVTRSFASASLRTVLHQYKMTHLVMSNRFASWIGLATLRVLTSPVLTWSAARLVCFVLRRPLPAGTPTALWPVPGPERQIMPRPFPLACAGQPFTPVSISSLLPLIRRAIIICGYSPVLNYARNALWQQQLQMYFYHTMAHTSTATISITGMAISIATEIFRLITGPPDGKPLVRGGHILSVASLLNQADAFALGFVWGLQTFDHASLKPKSLRNWEPLVRTLIDWLIVGAEAGFFPRLFPLIQQDGASAPAEPVYLLQPAAPGTEISLFRPWTWFRRGLTTDAAWYMGVGLLSQGAMLLTQYLLHRRVRQLIDERATRQVASLYKPRVEMSDHDGDASGQGSPKDH